MFFYRKLRKRLRNAYGKRPQGEYYDGDMNWISTFYEDCRKDGRDPFYVDDITWNDLNMDAVYKRINCCCSTAGERQLYYMLRRPMNREQYEKQSSLIRMMEQEPEKRLNLQVILSRIGIYRSVFLGHILRPQNPSKKWLIIYHAGFRGMRHPVRFQRALDAAIVHVAEHLCAPETQQGLRE